MSLYLGVDGGNSKAVAVVAAANGDAMGAAHRLGTADIYAAGGEQASIDLVAGTIDEALADAGTRRSEIRRAVFSLAGADWPEDFGYHARAWGEFGFGGPVEVVNDAIGALAGAVPIGPAVVVSIGTGAATGARGLDGRVWHSSFWQAPHGAAELAHRAFAAVVRAELGIGPATALRDMVIAISGDIDVDGALHRFTARGAEPLPVGPIARALLGAARNGDVVAMGIVEEHGRGLGAVAAVVGQAGVHRRGAVPDVLHRGPDARRRHDAPRRGRARPDALGWPRSHTGASAVGAGHRRARHRSAVRRGLRPPRGGAARRDPATARLLRRARALTYGDCGDPKKRSSHCSIIGSVGAAAAASSSGRGSSAPGGMMSTCSPLAPRLASRRASALMYASLCR